MVFSEKALVALFTDEVPFPVVRVQVFFEMVGLQELFVTLWTSYLTVSGIKERISTERWKENDMLRKKL